MGQGPGGQPVRVAPCRLALRVTGLCVVVIRQAGGPLLQYRRLTRNTVASLAPMLNRDSSHFGLDRA